MATTWDSVTDDERWGCLETCAGVSEETLRVATDGWGFSQGTLETVLYAVAGYNAFDQVEHFEDCPLYGIENGDEE